MSRAFSRRLAVLAAVGFAWLAVVSSISAAAENATRTFKTGHTFAGLLTRVEKAIADNGMALVASASASAGAARRGVAIPGNAVLMVFRNDYAVRMLQASVPAGFEAPIRIYVTENADGTASVGYRTPSALFAPYGNAAIDALARELDPIFEKIVRDAISP